MRKSTLAHSLVNLLMSIYKEEKKIYFANHARGCNYAIFSVRFFLLFLQKWQEILYCYEIFKKGIYLSVRGAGTRDEPLRTSAREATPV